MLDWILSQSRLLRTPRIVNIGDGESLPLDSPVHGSVGNDEGRNNVENLVAETAEGVEDGSVESTGKGTLAVRGQSVGGDALGGRATWKITY